MREVCHPDFIRRCDAVVGKKPDAENRRSDAMNSSWTKVAAIGFSLTVFCGPGLAMGPKESPDSFQPVSRPMPPKIAARTPWGEATGGLACRLLTLPEYCVGEPVWAIVEVTNTSDRAIYFHNVMDIH